MTQFPVIPMIRCCFLRRPRPIVGFLLIGLVLGPTGRAARRPVGRRARLPRGPAPGVCADGRATP